MLQWEYCAVVGVFNSYQNRNLAPKYPAVWYFTPSGTQVVEIKSRRPEEVTHTIAQLGEEGWEMAGCGNLDVAQHAIYFKRPKVRPVAGEPRNNDHGHPADVAPLPRP